jgi:hypothetical protein
MMASYDMDYALKRLRDAIAFVEIEHDFIPLRKWVNEVEQSGHEMEAIETRPNDLAWQDSLLTTLPSVAARELSPEEGLLRIRLWLASCRKGLSFSDIPIRRNSTCDWFPRD